MLALGALLVWTACSTAAESDAPWIEQLSAGGFHNCARTLDGRGDG